MFRHVSDVHFEHRKNISRGNFFDGTQQNFSPDHKKLRRLPCPALRAARSEKSNSRHPKKQEFEASNVHRSVPMFTDVWRSVF